MFTAVSAIRTQVRNMECKMLWPPQAADLKTESIELGEYFSRFFNFLPSGKISMFHFCPPPLTVLACISTFLPPTNSIYS